MKQQQNEGWELAWLMTFILIVVGLCVSIVEVLRALVRRFSGKELAFAFVAFMLAYMLESWIAYVRAARKAEKTWNLKHWNGDGWRRRYIKFTGNTPPKRAW